MSLRALQSTAVMARRTEPADSLDFFPTPPWATRAFLEHVLHLVWPELDRFDCVAWDPACGEGHMAAVLAERFAQVEASDIHDYGFGRVADFLVPGPKPVAQWIFTNPPFKLALEFVLDALELAARGVAVLVRTQFLEGQDRYRKLFRYRPPNLVAQFVERVPMHRGRWVINGKTATSYAWLVWLNRRRHDQTRAGPQFAWIPPCRTALTRHDDWLRFGGCMDLPADHPVIKALKERDRLARLERAA